MMDILVYLRKGALLAQNPGGVEDIPELDDADREVIRREKTRMRAPFFFVSTGLTITVIPPRQVEPT